MNGFREASAPVRRVGHSSCILVEANSSYQGSPMVARGLSRRAISLRFPNDKQYLAAHRSRPREHPHHSRSVLLIAQKY